MADDANGTVARILEEAHREEQDAGIEGPLTKYFGRGKRDPFTGSRFETIGGNWNQPETLYCFTPADLVALATLSVSVSGKAATEILSGPFQREASEILCQIDPDLDITDNAADDQLRNSDSAANRLWKLFRPSKDSGQPNVDDFGQVRTSKLLARKRPALLPIYDSVVATVLGLSGSRDHWSLMRDIMTADGCAVREQAEKLRVEARVDDTVTPLRIVDIVLWMHGKEQGYASSEEA